VSDHCTTVRGGTIVMSWVAGVFSIHGVVPMGAGRATASGSDGMDSNT
jgi:hypothetical protein